MSVNKIAVIDYDAGNLRSIINALETLDVEVDLIKDPQKIAAQHRLLLPGVGAFAPAMASLRENGMLDAIQEHLSQQKPLLGICLGMQLLCKKSFENGEHEGIGWFNADVIPFTPSPEFKVPHMGWNAITKYQDNPILNDIENDNDVYFVHSYHVKAHDDDIVITCSNHGIDFTSIIGKDNVFGMQFHPEKSQTTGLRLLSNFMTL